MIKNLQPHYEQVARVFNGPDAAHPGLVIMARVDCATQVICLSFYPTTLVYL